MRYIPEPFRINVESKKVAPAISAGLIAGFGLAIAGISFASIIFSGPLSSYSSQGIGLLLFGKCAACLIIALKSEYRGAVAGLPTAAVVVMLLIGSTIQNEGIVLFITTVAVITIGAVAIGVICLMIGHFRLTNIVRFIPYPVASGFVAGLGGVLCLAAMSLMGAKVEWQALSSLIEPSMLWKWAPGAAYGIGLFIIIRRWNRSLILPASVVLITAVYHLSFQILEISSHEAANAGFMLIGTSNGGLWPAISPSDLAYIDWASCAAQIPNVMILIAVALFCIVMNISGMEVAVKKEFDWNREFKLTGWASIVSGIGGGAFGTILIPPSFRSKLLGAETRLTGLVSALFVGVVLFVGDGIIELVPISLLGGFLIFTGLVMIQEGIVRNFKHLPRSEFGIVILIFFTIMFFGVVQGVIIGLLATLIFLAVRLSLVDPISSAFNISERTSRRDLSVPDKAILRMDGNRVRAFFLRGYVFFGSAIFLMERLNKELNQSPKPVCILLDFHAVTGFDYSAVNVLCRYIERAHAVETTIVLSFVSEQLKNSLESNLPRSAYSRLVMKQDADRAIEFSENLLIESWKTNQNKSERQRDILFEHTAGDIDDYLEKQIVFEELLMGLESWSELCMFDLNEELAANDKRMKGLVLLIGGRVSVYDSSGTRLHQFSSGDAVAKLEFFGESAVKMVADEPSRTILLSPSNQQRLVKKEEKLVLKLYKYLLSRQNNPFQLA